MIVGSHGESEFCFMLVYPLWPMYHVNVAEYFALTTWGHITHLHQHWKLKYFKGGGNPLSLITDWACTINVCRSDKPTLNLFSILTHCNMSFTYSANLVLHSNCSHKELSNDLLRALQKMTSVLRLLFWIPCVPHNLFTTYLIWLPKWKIYIVVLGCHAYIWNLSDSAVVIWDHLLGNL